MDFPAAVFVLVWGTEIYGRKPDACVRWGSDRGEGLYSAIMRDYVKGKPWETMGRKAVSLQYQVFP